MKKFLSLILIIALSVPCTTIADADDIATCSTGFVSLFARIDISNGQVTGTGGLLTNSNHSTRVSVFVQKKVGNSWSTIASSSGVEAATVTVSATKGTTYRVYSTCKVYDAAGNLSDTSTSYSAEKTY